MAHPAGRRVQHHRRSARQTKPRTISTKPMSDITAYRPFHPPSPSGDRAFPKPGRSERDRVHPQKNAQAGDQYAMPSAP